MRGIEDGKTEGEGKAFKGFGNSTVLRCWCIIVEVGWFVERRAKWLENCFKFLQNFRLINIYVLYTRAAKFASIGIYRLRAPILYN